MAKPAVSPEEISVCIDCIQLLTNGEMPGIDYEGIILSLHVASIDRRWHGIELHADGEELGFCHSHCEACGSHLAGDRFKAIAWM